MAEQEENQQERTEQATPKRKEDARKKGNVAKSIEVNSTAILLISVLFFFFAGSYMLNTMSYYSRVVFENFGSVSLNSDNLQGYLQLAAVCFMKIVLPFAVTIIMIGLAVNYMQVGPLFTLEPLTPKFSKVNPISGMKRVLFSRKAFVELVKNVIKIIIVGIIAYFSIRGQVNEYVSLMDQSAMQLVAYTGKAAFALGIKITLALVLLSILDFIFQKFEYERNLRMTKQEVREELRQYEGDPHIKARVRSIQREMARRRMMEGVPEADVVITNPVEIAVALKYMPKEMEAPKLVAKGRRKIAEKIREIAIEYDIPIVENKPLAWGLFKAMNIGDLVPEQLFQAVAEVLAYVYRLKNKKIK